MDNENTKSATATAPIKNTNTRPPVVPKAQTTENFLVIWLDANIDPLNDDYQTGITKLREISDTVNTFTNVDECLSFITGIDDKKVFIIFSGALGETTVPTVHDMVQVSAIYIFCGDKVRHQQWAQQYPKIKGVFTDFKLILEDLKKAIQKGDQNTNTISSVATTGSTTNENLDTLDASFMYTQILKEILLTIDFQSQQFIEFITYSRREYDGNSVELKNIDKLEHEYRRHTPIWWYTYDCFLYSMVNCALRTMEVNHMIKLGFFIRDLHEHIVRLHSEQNTKDHHSKSFVVYYSQGLPSSDVDQLVKTQGGLLSFNHFLLTNKKRQVSLDFACQTMTSSDMMGILYVMIIDPSICSIPFADIRDVSYHENQDEVLISMHLIFRIKHIQNIDGNNRLWQVDLTLTTDNDPQLYALTDCIREETFLHENGWYRLSNLLIKLGQFNQAQEVYENMLTQTTDDREKTNIYHQLGLANDDQGQYAEVLSYYEKALEIKQKTLPPNHPDLATSYDSIGKVYDNMGEHAKALSFYEKALEICQKTLPPNHPDLATSYDSIGKVYDNMGEHAKALSFYEKALEIKQKALPPNHPDLSTSYGNIGSVYEQMDEPSKALSFYEKALEIKQEALPPNHPDLATSYDSIGKVYDNIGEHAKALSFYEKALEIKQKALPPNHPDLSTSYGNIGSVYEQMDEPSKALSFYEKALQIKQEALPPNHPDLATSYDSIGKVYDNMGEHAKALSFYEKALEIKQKALPPNHPDLSTSYGNIGSVYEQMDEHSKALSFYEKALEIKQEALPPNHPDLATPYDSIGKVYDNMGEHAKALSCYEKALEIKQEALPPNHPDLATSYDSIGKVYDNMGEHAKALSFYEKALEIKQKALPPNHPDLSTSYGNIGSVYEQMDEPSKALSFYEKALQIKQEALPPNHPDLATSYDSIGKVYDNMGEHAKALSFYEKALEIKQEALPPNHPDLSTSYSSIGNVYDKSGEYSKALSFHQRALDIGQDSLPANHPQLQLYKDNVETIKKKL